METNDTEIFSEALPDLTDWFQNSYFAVFTSSILMSVVLFPLYAYVFKMNRKHDQETLLFPAVNHFYQMTRNTYFIYLSFICFFCLTFTHKHKGQYFNLAFPFLLYGLYTIAHVFSLLTFLLALQRLVLYFSPATEKYVIKVQKQMSKRFWILYAICIIKDLVFVMATYKGYQKSFQITCLIFFIIFNMLSLLSALLHIPIYLSVKKLSYLASAKSNTPQRFIIWQTATVVIFKCTYIPTFLAFLLGELSLLYLVLFSLSIDFFTTPLIVELSYIGCNKRNMKTFFTAFSFRKFIRVLFDMKPKVSVEPQRF
ncbi:Serpentine Receptor, class Z [Caenorhabditis elegans]|uniref:Serpentine Receptor, class Z n=1 Tax=Caenorhabditis elegans TaxID=6239 RepID=Q5WRK8_CAEEL|nr:Serpentine Receptor, class Z [Caenorhabditis elegans]CAH60792.1 Serpentine Receptor, class Z [Caenorhabditis elegans]|eukprot:NP_001023586.1 Serpentine Receptor, class Z [Caenorhabditis elegans]